MKELNMKNGDAVLVEGWSLDQGHRIDKWEITALSSDSIELRHIASYRKGGNGVVEFPGSGELTRHGGWMIQHLSIPFAERWTQHIAEMRELCEQLAKLPSNNGNQ